MPGGSSSQHPRVAYVEDYDSDEGIARPQTTKPALQARPTSKSFMPRTRETDKESAYSGQSKDSGYSSLSAATNDGASSSQQLKTKASKKTKKDKKTTTTSKPPSLSITITGDGKDVKVTGPRSSPEAALRGSSQTRRSQRVPCPGCDDPNCPDTIRPSRSSSQHRRSRRVPCPDCDDPNCPDATRPALRQTSRRESMGDIALAGSRSMLPGPLGQRPPSESRTRPQTYIGDVPPWVHDRSHQVGPWTAQTPPPFTTTSPAYPRAPSPSRLRRSNSSSRLRRSSYDASYHADSTETLGPPSPTPGLHPPLPSKSNDQGRLKASSLLGTRPRSYYDVPYPYSATPSPTLPKPASISANPGPSVMRSLLGTRAQSYHEVPHQTNAMLPPMPPPRPVPSAWTSPPPAPSAWISSQLLTTAPGQARPRAPSASKLQHQSQDELFKSYNTETHRSPAPSLAQSKRKPTKLNKPKAQGSDNRASSPNSSHNKPDPHTESSIPIEFKPASPEEQVSQQTTNKVSHTGHDDPHRRKSGSLSHLKKSSEQMRAVFKDTEDIGTRKRNTGELLREAEKLKMADNCTDCRDSNCSDATQTPLSQQKALPATSTPTTKTGATELPPISPVSLSRHSSYQGWILRKAEPLPGELTSWARIEKNSMPFSQEALARTVKIRNTRTPVMQEYDELPYENLRTQVDRLVTDCQLIEKDPNVKWSLASIEPVAVQHPKYRRPEIVIMHVILESSSGGKASEHASSNSTPTLSEGEDDVRLDKQLALPETSRPSNFSEISSVVDLSTPLVLPGRSALRMGRPPSVGSSTYVGSDSDTDQKHENALEHEGFAEQNGLLGQSKEVDAWLASFDRDDDLVADKELMARLPNLYKTHLRQKNAEKLMQGLMEEGKTQDDLAKAFEDELVKRRSSGLSEPANVENDSAADLSEKEDKLDAQGHPETEKQTGMAEKTPEYLTAGKPTKTETQRINREEQKPQNNSRAADKLVAGEMTSDTSVSSSALITEGGLPLEQRDYSSNRNGTSFKTRKMKRKNLKGLQFPKGLPRIDDNITAIEKVEPKQAGSLLMTSQEKQSRKQSEIKFAKVVCYLWLMRKWPYVPSQKRYHVKHWPGRGADDTQANVMQDVGKPVVDQNINKKLVGQQKPHPKKLVKLRWICTCGQLFEEVMEELVAGAVQELASELSTPDCSDIGLSTLSSSTSSLPETNPSSFDSSAKSRKPYSGSDDLAIDIDGSTDAESSQFPRVQKYILLCLASKGQENLEHADMSSAKTDRCMYSEFHRRYFTPMRRLVRLLTLRMLDRIEFTRFQLFNKASVAIESGDIGALPPNTARDYEYERKHPYRPLIPLTALKHWTENPSHARSRPLHINRVPTKISGQLRWSEDDGGELEGWGLRFKETMSWRAVWVSEFLIAGTATAFAVFWCAYRNGDIQDGFTVAGVVLAYGTIFLGLVQGFAQYLEQSS